MITQNDMYLGNCFLHIRVCNYGVFVSVSIHLHKPDFKIANLDQMCACETFIYKSCHFLVLRGSMRKCLTHVELAEQL